MAFSVSNYRVAFATISRSAAAQSTTTSTRWFWFFQFIFSITLQMPEQRQLGCFFFFGNTMNSLWSSLPVREREMNTTHPFRLCSMFTANTVALKTLWPINRKVVVLYVCFECDAFHCQLSEMNTQYNGIFVLFVILKSWISHFHRDDCALRVFVVAIFTSIE